MEAGYAMCWPFPEPPGDHARRRLILFAGSLYMTKYLGKEFTPPEDQGQFIVRLEAPIDYSVDKADELFRPAEEILRGMPEVKAVFYRLGIGGSVNRRS